MLKSGWAIYSASYVKIIILRIMTESFIFLFDFILSEAFILAFIVIVF